LDIFWLETLSRPRPEEKMTLAGIKRRLGTACSNRARKSGWFKMTIAGGAPLKLF
jgi:hypothetical protein